MKTMVIVGGGNSLDPQDIEFLRASGAAVICINNAYQICPWADVLYARDFDWWATVDPSYYRVVNGALAEYSNRPQWTHAVRSQHEFGGERWTGSIQAADRFNLRVVQTRMSSGICPIPGVIHEGANGGASSGYQAVNLAVHMHATRILLYAFDMGATGAGHWHGRHPEHLANIPAGGYGPFATAFNSMAQPLAEMGVEVINCSRASNITCFPFSTLQAELRNESRNGQTVASAREGNPC